MRNPPLPIGAKDSKITAWGMTKGAIGGTAYGMRGMATAPIKAVYSFGSHVSEVDEAKARVDAIGYQNFRELHNGKGSSFYTWQDLSHEDKMRYARMPSKTEVDNTKLDDADIGNKNPYLRSQLLKNSEKSGSETDTQQDVYAFSKQRTADSFAATKESEKLQGNKLTSDQRDKLERERSIATSNFLKPTPPSSAVDKPKSLKQPLKTTNKEKPTPTATEDQKDNARKYFKSKIELTSKGETADYDLVKKYIQLAQQTGTIETDLKLKTNIVKSLEDKYKEANNNSTTADRYKVKGEIKALFRILKSLDKSYKSSTIEKTGLEQKSWTFKHDKFNTEISNLNYHDISNASIYYLREQEQRYDALAKEIKPRAIEISNSPPRPTPTKEQPSRESIINSSLEGLQKIMNDPKSNNGIMILTINKTLDFLDPRYQSNKDQINDGLENILKSIKDQSRRDLFLEKIKDNTRAGSHGYKSNNAAEGFIDSRNQNQGLLSDLEFLTNGLGGVFSSFGNSLSKSTKNASGNPSTTQEQHINASGNPSTRQEQSNNAAGNPSTTPHQPIQGSNLWDVLTKGINGTGRS